MPLSSIATVLGGVSTAIDIAKTLKEIDKSVETADLRLKIADLVSTLADTKLAMIEIQDDLRTKDECGSKDVCYGQILRSSSKKNQTKNDGHRAQCSREVEKSRK